jgi:anti-sigma-K factor RskA
MRDPDVDRLLRAAANAGDEGPAEMPFGFDTRVLARARGERAAKNGDAWEVLRLFRRIATVASIVAVCAGAAAFWQFRNDDDLDETTANAYAMADTVIEAAAWQ